MTQSESTPRFTLNRAAVLNYILLFFGTTLTLAAIIFFFAYNWDSLPKLAKLGTVQVGFLACAIGAIVTAKHHVLSQTLLFAASVIVGVFLAVFGQIYQTGADPWQLFVLWAVLIIPFALIAKNEITWIAFATVAAIGTSLYLRFFVSEDTLLEPIGFTVQILIPSLFLAAIWLKFEYEHRTQNLPKPWSRTLLAAIVFAVLTIGTMATSHGLNDASNALPAFAFYALLAAATAAVWNFFGRSNFDITVLGTAAIAWLLATSWTLTFSLFNIDFDPILIFFFMAAYFIGASSALVFVLRQLIAQRRHDAPPASFSASIPDENPQPELQPEPQPKPASHHEPSSSRILPILSGIAGWFASFFFLGAIFLAVGFDNAETTMFSIAVVLTIIVIATEFASRSNETLRNSAFIDQAIIPLSLSAQWLVGFTLVENGNLFAQIGAIALICVIHYALIRSNTLRFLTAATFITAYALYQTANNQDTDYAFLHAACTLTAGLFFIASPYIKETFEKTLAPAAYAATIAVFTIAWFAPTNLAVILTTAITITALALAAFENRRNPNTTKLLIAATCLAALSFFAYTTILWALTVFAIGLWRERATLTALGLVGFALSLTAYYYNLNVTLLTKSGILLASGLLFIALFWFLELNKNTTNPTTLEVNP